MKTLKQYILIVAATVSLILAPAAAEAYTPLQCTATGAMVAGTSLFDSSNSATGVCFYQGIQYIFSQIICNFVNIVNVILGTVYCSIQYSIQNTLAILLTLYIMVFGAQILMGTAQLNAKEIVIRLLKVAGVWTFATNAAWGIGFAFQFFMAVMVEVSYWIVSTIFPAANVTSGTVMPLFAYIDQLIYGAVTGPFTNANDKLIGFFLLMVGVYPPIFMIAVYWLWETLTLMVRTIINYLLAISAIAFLISLSPVFLSFMLFQATFHLFEKWLCYMISYVTQIIVVFAVIVMWIIVMSSFLTPPGLWAGTGFFTQLPNLIFDYSQVVQEAAVTDNPDSSWAICPNIRYGITPYGLAAACQPGFNPVKNQKDKDALIPPLMISKITDFIYYLVYEFAILAMLAYAFNVMLKNAPKVARDIVGGCTQLPQMGAGMGNLGLGSLTGGSPRILPAAASRPGLLPPPGVEEAQSATGNFVSRMSAALSQRPGTVVSGLSATNTPRGNTVARSPIGLGTTPRLGTAAGGAGTSANLTANTSPPGSATPAWGVPNAFGKPDIALGTRFLTGAGMMFASTGANVTSAWNPSRLDPTASAIWGSPDNFADIPRVNPSAAAIWGSPDNFKDVPTFDPTKAPAWVVSNWNPNAPSAWTLVALNPNEAPIWTIVNVVGNIPPLNPNADTAWHAPGFDPTKPSAWTLVALNPNAPAAWGLVNVFDVPGLKTDAPTAWNAPGINPDITTATNAMLGIRGGLPPLFNSTASTMSTAWNPVDFTVMPTSQVQQLAAQQLLEKLRQQLGNNVPQNLQGLLLTNVNGLNESQLADFVKEVELLVQSPPKTTRT